MRVAAKLGLALSIMSLTLAVGPASAQEKFTGCVAGGRIPSQGGPGHRACQALLRHPDPEYPGTQRGRRVTWVRRAIRATWARGTDRTPRRCGSSGPEG